MEVCAAIIRWGRGTRQKLGVFGTVGGFALALVLVVVIAGAPASTHAAGLFDWASDPVGKGLSLIAYVIFTFCNYILGLVAVLFNFVVEETVFNFGHLFATSAGILTAWGILRDVANILLLFGFIFMGVATILNVHSYEAKKTLPNLIIFAVLLNFSLLASQLVIDTSNIFSAQLYSKTGSGTCSSGTANGTINGGECNNVGISGLIFSATGVNGIFNSSTVERIEKIPPSTRVIVYLSMAIFSVITAVVLLAGAIMLVIRAVVLAFLMVLSPIGFAGLAVPPLAKFAHTWWDKLLSQAFFAPVYLLLIFVSLKVAQGLNSNLASGNDLAGALIEGRVGAMQVILVFALIIGFMIASLVTAKQMGAMGANFAMSTSRRVVSAPFKPFRAMSAAAGRNTASYAGGKAEGAYNKFASKVSENRAGKFLLRTTGLDESISHGIAGVKNLKVDGKSKADKDKEYAHRDHEITVADNARKLGKTITENPGDAKAIATQIQKMDFGEVANYVKGAKAAEIEAIGKALSPEKFEQIMKKDDIDGTVKHELQHARFAEFDGKGDAAAVTAMDADKKEELQKKLRSLTIKDLEQMAKYNNDALNAFVEASNDKDMSILSEDQLEALQKSNALAQESRALAKENMQVGRIDRWMKEDATKQRGATAFKNMTTKDRMKLKGETLVMPELVANFGPGDMQAIVMDNKLTQDQMTAVRTRLENDAQKRAEMDTFFAKNDLAAGLWKWKVQSTQGVNRNTSGQGRRSPDRNQ